MATSTMLEHAAVRQAAAALRRASFLVITAGAGMGVDSGFPDFRGPQGFWRAYPPYERLGLRFEEMASPDLFDADDELAWGFYGHRTHLYRRTAPHKGYGILRSWARDGVPSSCATAAPSQPRASDGDALPTFVFTSNVDGGFPLAGFSSHQVFECHGSTTHLQCTDGVCASNVRANGAKVAAPARRDGVDVDGWPAVWPTPRDFAVAVDEASMRAERGSMPRCVHCGALARPNVLMFGDYAYTGARQAAQQRRLGEFLDAHSATKAPSRAASAAGGVVVECGAGSGIPTVRHFSESLCGKGGVASLVRINVREPQVPRGVEGVGIASGALAALEAIDTVLRSEA